MSDELSKDEPTTIPIDPDEHTTAPEPDKPGKWKMPEPVFQQSSGYLPQGYVEQIQKELQEAATAEKSAPEQKTTGAESTDPPPANPATPPPAGIEPQPDLSEVLSFEAVVPAAPAAAVKQKSKGLRLVLLILGLLAILVFAVAFVAVVYYLFLAPTGEVNNF